MTRVEKLPIWIPLYAGLLALTGLFGGPLGLPALDIPLDDPAYFARSLGLSAALLTALWLRAPAAYAAGFAAAIIREIGDIFAQWTGPDPAPQAFVLSAIFLALNILCLSRTLKAARKKAPRR